MSETKPGRADHGAYVRKVQEDTQNFAHGLIGEVERLRVLVAALESEKEGLTAQLRDVETVIRANDSLRAQIEGIKAETSAYSSRYAEVEQQNSNLANLYVASYQLHGTLDRQRVLNAIQEIVINLVGSEELAVFEMDEPGAPLTLSASVGIDPESWREIPSDRGIIGHVASTGERFVEGVSTDLPLVREVAMTACIPLKLDHRVIGVIAIFGLLPQKQGLAPVDHELFDLLATHAATALFCTRIQKLLEIAP